VVFETLLDSLDQQSDALKAKYDIDIRHLVSVLLELLPENVWQDEVLDNEDHKEDAQSAVIFDVPVLFADQALGALEHEPVNNPLEKLNDKTGNLVYVKRVLQHDWQQEELEDLLLWLLSNKLVLDLTYLAKKQPDEDVVYVAEEADEAV